jgi:hypothetical protein
MIHVSTGHYIVFCAECSSDDREEAEPGERIASRRLAVGTFLRRGWQQEEGRSVRVAQQGLGMGAWRCPACVGRVALEAKP